MTARQIINILKANGWALERINGSHHIFSRPGHRAVPVPVHNNQDLGILGKRILKQAGIKDWEVFK